MSAILENSQTFSKMSFLTGFIGVGAFWDSLTAEDKATYAGLCRVARGKSEFSLLRWQESVVIQDAYKVWLDAQVEVVSGESEEY